MCSQTSEASSTHIPEAGTCSSWTSDSYSACSPSGAVSGRNHTDTWAGCIVSLTTPARPLPTNLMLMVLVSWAGVRCTPLPPHSHQTTRRSSLIPSALDDPP
jgi:hypothetical protein